MASISPNDPDPRTADDEEDDAAGKGASSTNPAEGADDEPGEDSGSPHG